jgi:hypothetical protein
MGTLEKIMDMKKNGIPESEIIASLKNEGISPLEISDSLNQSKIKEAVGEASQTEGMTPSIMGNEEEEEEIPTPEDNSPAPGDVYSPQGNPPPQPRENNYSINAGNPGESPQYGEELYAVPQPPETYMPQAQPMEGEYYDEYSQEGYTDYGSSSDTMIEIAEQVFSENLKVIEEQIRNLNEFKTIYSTRIDDINERLKRMEKYFDKMQMSIIDSVGGYGKELDLIKKEMDMIEDSFSKISKK